MEKEVILALAMCARPWATQWATNQARAEMYMQKVRWTRSGVDQVPAMASGGRRGIYVASLTKTSQYGDLRLKMWAKMTGTAGARKSWRQVCQMEYI